MAISFIQQPSNTPLRIWDAYNDVIYVVESSLALATSVSFSVVINNGFAIKIDKPLDITTKRAYVNIKEVLRDYLISTFQTTNTLTRNINNVVPCYISVLELNAIGSVIGTIGISNATYVLNTSQTFKEMFTSNFENIDVSLNVTPSFLTDITTKNVFDTDRDYLSFYYGGGHMFLSR